MKILLINTVYGTGSTGKICAHLYSSAKKNGFTPYIAYGRNTCNEANSYRIGNKLDFFVHVFSNFFCGNSGFASQLVTTKFLEWVDTIHPDLIHLHNIHGFYINIPLLFKFIKSRNIPVVWTLHDCWPITGQCSHFDYIQCSRWKTQCHHCPQYRSAYPYSLFKDNSFHNYNNKKAAFQHVPNLTIVTPSAWLGNIVKQSFLSEYPIQIIPNGIDTNLFAPAKKENFHPPYVLGVANTWNDRKGLSFFLELSKLLAPNLHVILIGTTNRQKKKIERLSQGKIQCLNHTESQQELALYYSNAIAFVNPTLEDTFPTTNLEALSCGTPVITFCTGGAPEAITKTSGIILKEKSVYTLKQAIDDILSSPQITSESCRQAALKYDKSVRYEEYIQLYKELLSSP